MGAPVITANSIRVEPGIGEFNMGDPRVGLKIRRMNVVGIPNDITVGRPRVTPHTIYAVLEGTTQAKLNHPTPQAPHPVNSFELFGRAFVQNRILDKVRASSHSSMEFGRPYVYNRKGYISPTGTKMQRFGWLTIPGDINVELYSGIGVQGLGIPAVSRPPYVGPLYMQQYGWQSNAFGSTNIELFNRQIYPRGDDLSLMGRSQYLGGPPNTPYAWRHLHVGPPKPTIPNGLNATIFGLAWISLWVRGVEPEGIDSFVMDYDYQQFDKRMRIVRALPTKAPARTVHPQGFRLSNAGMPNVRIGTQYIRPDGNSDQFRKGAW